MMPTLRLVQELVGWLPSEGMMQVAQKLAVHPSQVREAATFYVMFFTEKPGKYVIDVCTNISCSLCGSDKVLEHLERKLGDAGGEHQQRWPLDAAGDRMPGLLWYCTVPPDQ